MEFLRRLIQQVKTQLTGLKTSEKMVIALLLVIFAGAVYWMVQYAAEHEMVSLPQMSAATEEQRNVIIQHLDTWGEEYQIKGNLIEVPKSREETVWARLASVEALSSEAIAGWSNLIEDTNIWMPEASRKDKKIVVLQIELASTISRFPYVNKADVFINPGGKRLLSNQTPAASASVWVQTTGDPNKKKLASAIAALVSSANNRMKREDVKIIIDDTLVPVAPEGEEFASDYIEMQVTWEKHYRDKIIKEALPAGMNALVVVDIKPLNTSTQITTKKFLEENQGTVSLLSETVDSGQQSKTRDASQREPGVVGNIADADQTAGTAQDDETNDSTTKFDVNAGYTMTAEETPRGGIAEVTAAVSIPLSYWEDMAKNNAGNDQKPDPVQVANLEIQQIPLIKERVMRAIGLVGEQYKDNVVVDSYWAGGTSGQPGTMGIAGPGGQGTAEAGTSITGIAHQYGKHVAISALAMISLFMVLMMVRKASGPVNMTVDEAESVIGKKPVDVMGLEETNLVDGEDSGLLAGVELDSKAIRSQQVLQQVRAMVNETPEVAASLLGKWLEEEN